jgi:hypothetical protein
VRGLALLGTGFAARPAVAGGFDAAIDAAVRPLTDAVSKVVFYKVALLGAEIPLVGIERTSYEISQVR